MKWPTRIRLIEGQLMTAAEVSFRFAGHQTFPLRISWLPKTIHLLKQGKDPLTDTDLGITSIGLGKNMVDALRCWIEAFQVATKTDSGWQLTPIGSLIFDPTSGLDPYLEDHSTAWLLHWLIATEEKSPFFAWECLFNRWTAPDFTATAVLEAFRRESESNLRPASPVTLRQHWEVFIHSYRPPRSGRGEDHLDCVLSVLGLIRESGKRADSEGRMPQRYEFDFSFKSSIPQELFAYFLHDWWSRTFPAESTVPVSAIVSSTRSPGRILRMPEREIIDRLEALSLEKPAAFKLVEAANIRQVYRRNPSDGFKALKKAYRNPHFN
jgi:hypothetical protein